MSSYPAPALPAEGAVHERALRELAHLALVAQSGGTQSSSAALDALLDYLRTVTGAQRATLLLRAGPFEDAGTSASAATFIGRSRTLAASGADAGAGDDLVSGGIFGDSLGAENGSDCWLTHSLPLTAEPGASPSDEQRAHAVLVLGWGATAGGCAQAAEAKQFLDGIAEAAGATVAAVLQAERAAALDPQGRDEGGARREADRVRADLLGTVSHELRSPLTAIKGYAETLRRHEQRLSRDERTEFLRAIEGASDRLSIIVDRLLEVSQLEGGEVSLHLMSVDLRQLVESALGDAEARQGQAGEPKHRLTLRKGDEPGNGEAEGPVLAVGDARYLRDMVDALLENAVKYSPEGGAIDFIVRPARAIPAGLMPAPSAHGYVELVVRDAGIGIPSHHLARIFETFHRVDTRLTREADGLGLGLALCRRVVELHQGAIWAESEPGSGSEFHVLLPAGTADAAD